jgi:DnaK suppressor protein
MFKGRVTRNLRYDPRDPEPDMQKLDDAKRYLLLSRSRAELRERLARIRYDRQHGEAPLDPDFSEQAVQLENDEVLDRLESSLQWELEQIGRALSRLDIGHGELCSECGRTIEAARLSALPYATQCAPCATRQSAVAA